MWPYTHDESHWLTTLSILETGHTSPFRSPSIAELEAAARRYRSRVIANMVKSAFRSVRRLVRKALHRRPDTAKPPGGLVGAAD